MVVMPEMEMQAMAGMDGHAAAMFAWLTSIWELRCGMLFWDAEDRISAGKNKGGRDFSSIFDSPIACHSWTPVT